MNIQNPPIFSHPLNILLLVSSIVASLWTMDIRPLVVGALAEGWWWWYGPSWWDRAHGGPAYSVDDEEQTYVRSLSEPLRERFLRLDHIRHEIRTTVSSQPLLSSVGLDEELEKINRLLMAWLHVAVRWSREQDLAARRRTVGYAERAASVVKPTAATEPAEASDQMMWESTDVLQELQTVEDALGSIRDRVRTWSQPDRERLSRTVDELLLGMGAAGRALRDVQAIENTYERPIQRAMQKKKQTHP